MAQYTLTNLIPTHVGDSAWSAGTLSTTHVLYSSKSLQLTGTTSTNEIYATYQAATIPQVQNHIYYSRIYEYHESSSLNGKGWQVYWPAAEPYFNSTPLGAAGQWNMLSARNVRSNWASANQAIRVDFDNAKTAGSVWYDGFMMIDLTATFGAGSEPNQEWCDKNIPFFIGSKIISVSLPTVYDLSISTPTSLKNGDIVNCPYTGDYKTLTLKKGTYKLECWGAQGSHSSSSFSGGNGGYSIGTLTLSQNTTLYLYTGGQPSGSAAGFNGGGTASRYGGGGGASDIRINNTSLYARVIVAGGGGGSSSYSTSYGNGGAGGGESGTKSNGADSFNTWGGYPGTQTGPYKSSSYVGTFGIGGASYAGGGGGWYGGDGGYFAIAGGGGSGYIYTSSTASNYPSGCILNSSYYLTEASTTAGNVSFTSPTGTAETGHSGNGHVRITVIEAGYTISYDANGGTGAPAEQQKEVGSSINFSTVKPTKASILSPVTANFYRLQTIIETKTVNATESFTFTHWNTAADGTGQTYLPGDTYDLDASIVLYAQYSSSYGPAQVVMPNCDNYTDEARDMIHLISDGGIYNSIQLSGTLEYNFVGWGTDPYNTVHEQKEKEENELPQVGDTVTISGNTNFYANFENISRYNPVELPILTSFSRKFIGWYLPRDKKVYNGIYTPVTKNNLYAVWTDILGEDKGIYDVFIFKGGGNSTTVNISLPSGKTWSKLVYGKGIYAAISGSTVAYSKDLLNWTEVDADLEGELIYRGNYFFIIGHPVRSGLSWGSENEVKISSDCSTWNRCYLPQYIDSYMGDEVTIVWYSIDYDNINNKYCALGIYEDTVDFGGVSSVSSDTLSWTQPEDSTGIVPSASGIGIYFKDKFISGAMPPIFTYSFDGLNWLSSECQEEGYAAAFSTSDNTVIALIAAHVNNSITICRSTDGINWNQILVTSSNSLYDYTNILYGNGRFVIYSDSKIQISVDEGLTWSEYNIPTHKEITFVKDRFVLQLTSGSMMESTDAITWKPMQKIVYDVEPFNEYESYIYWNGTWIKQDNYIYPWVITNNNIWDDVNDRFTWAQVGTLDWSGLAREEF